MELNMPAFSSHMPIIKNRIHEINAMNNKLDACEHGARTYQNLPRHMQRRAVSLNPNRLPVSIRERHKRENKTQPKKTKRPSRKFRRKPNNLLKEYVRRQRDNVWLETHIWHAKCFHMSNMWGYVVPQRPTNKSNRAAIRSVKKLCLLQDVSYYGCMELEGDRRLLLSHFKSMLCHDSYEALLSIEKDNNSYSTLTLYHHNRYPFGAIGSADVLILPSDSQTLKVWLYVHPVHYASLKDVFIKTFELQYKQNQDSKYQHEFTSRVIESQLGIHTPVMDKAPVYINEVAGEVVTTLRVLKDNLNRFRLRGPTAHAVLSASLVPFDGSPLQTYPDLDKSELQVKMQQKLESYGLVENVSEHWWQTYYGQESNVEIHQRQVALWKSLAHMDKGGDCLNSCSDDIHHKILVAFTVRDPRVTFPKKKLPYNELQKRHTSDTTISTPYNKASIFDSALFSHSIRDAVTTSIIPTSSINARRASLLVSSELPLTHNEARIPVLLMAVPPAKQSQLSSGGWELIVPCGYGAFTWHSLVMNGGVPCGMSQADAIVPESLAQLPHNVPDMPQSVAHSVEQGGQMMKDFFKRPPNCRPNYLVLGIRDPFVPNWHALVHSWSGKGEGFVLRDNVVLEVLAKEMEKGVEGVREKDGRDVEEEISKKRKMMEDVDDDKNITNKERKKRRKELRSNNQKNNGTFVDCDVDVSTGDCIKGTKIVSNIQMENPIDMKLNLLHSPFVSLFKSIMGQALIRIKLTLMGKGLLEPLGIICVPSQEDWDKFDPRNPTRGPVEESHEDVFLKERKQLKKEHKKIETMLRKVRHRANRRANDKLIENAEKTKTIDSLDAKELRQIQQDNIEKTHKGVLEKYRSYTCRMQRRWLYPAEQSFQLASRQTMGYVTHSAFCTLQGTYGAIGYVVAQPLCDEVLPMRLKAIEQHTFHPHLSLPHVLVRNTSSLQYRWATLQVLVQT